MLTENLYVFVEGNTDNLFIKKIYNDFLLKISQNCKIVEYANQSKKKINNYLATIKKVKNWDYIFISDQDGKENKKEIRLAEFNYLDDDKFFLSVFEIESWIISGISDNLIKKYKLNIKNHNTSNFTKENFNNLIPKGVDRLEFISSILDDFNINKAIEMNESFKNFHNYINKKMQANDCF